MDSTEARLVSEYQRALRCWRCNSLKASLIICDDLTRDIDQLDGQSSKEAQHIKQLAWFLKIRCLADDYYINESLLLNEIDLESDDQVRVFSRSNKQSRQGTSGRKTTHGSGDLLSRRTTTSFGNGLDARRRTGTLTGRITTGLSRGNSRAATSYRPLTTSLTANQTAFSRTTRPLLKYATNSHLSKPFFEYLYNAQTVTNKCPDYRQCLEYITLVSKSYKNKGSQDKGELITIDERDDHLIQDAFWLIASGACYYNLNMYNHAEEYFARAVELNRFHLDSYAWLIKVYLKSNQSTKVIKACDDGLKFCKSDILYNWKARLQSMFGDLHGANLSLKESLAHFPTNLEALANVSHFAFYGDKLELALKGFQRILHLSTNRSTSIDGLQSINGSISQLFNNLALCNLHCGYYHRVIPLFQKALQSAPNKETTSDIWYNMSFVPLSCGLANLAMACLRLALKNNSQNEEAINNLGVLRCGHLIDNQLHFENRQEYWSYTQQNSSTFDSEFDLVNHDDVNQHRAMMDEMEVHFAATCNSDDDSYALPGQPEMLYNMAVVKERRGQLMAAVRYCHLYLDQDPNNYQIKSMLKEIRQLICHDA